MVDEVLSRVNSHDSLVFPKGPDAGRWGNHVTKWEGEATAELRLPDSVHPRHVVWPPRSGRVPVVTAI